MQHVRTSTTPRNTKVYSLANAKARYCLTSFHSDQWALGSLGTLVREITLVYLCLRVLQANFKLYLGTEGPMTRQRVVAET